MTERHCDSATLPACPTVYFNPAKCDYCGRYGEIGSCDGCGSPNRPVSQSSLPRWPTRAERDHGYPPPNIKVRK